MIVDTQCDVAGGPFFATFLLVFFFNDTATTEIYTLSLHDALPIYHGSTDNSYKIIKALAKKYSRVMVVKCPRKWKNAAEAKNFGVKFAKTDLVGFTDADSFPEKGAISKMIGFFDDLKVGAVTSTVLVKNRNNFVLRLQSIEYKVIKIGRASCRERV